MDAELKAKWIEALRSGKYSQAGGSLVTGLPGELQEFCCLGVLCDTQGTQWTGENDMGLLDGAQVRDVGRSYLSPTILKRFGLEEEEQITLAEMNDNGRDFDEIADYIEKNL
jgi:hypothetical protein